jgi:hypothetical protein
MDEPEEKKVSPAAAQRRRGRRMVKLRVEG